VPGYGAAGPVAPFDPQSAGMAWADSESPDQGGAGWKRYVSALLRYKWLVLGITLVGSVAGVGVARFLPPEYQATGTVWIEGGIGPGGPIRQGQLLDSYSWIELLRSFEVLDRVANERRLWLSAPPAGALALSSLQLTDSILTGTFRLRVDDSGDQVTLTRNDGLYSETVKRGEPLGRAAGFLWPVQPENLPPGLDLEFSVTTPHQAALALQQRLDAKVDREGNFMRLAFTGTDPVTLAPTLNAIMDRYVTFAADLKRDRLTETTRILFEQMESARRNMEQAETRLEQFRIRTITLPSEQPALVGTGLQTTLPPAMTNFFQMKVEQEQLQQDREALAAVLDAARDSAISIDALEIIGSARSSSQLAGLIGDLTNDRTALRVLLKRYTNDNPQVQTLRDQIREMETEILPRQIRGLMAELSNRESALNAQIGVAAADLERIPQRKIEEDRLTRQVTLASAVYTDLQTRHQQAVLAEKSSIPDVRILDRAVEPRRPTVNQAPRVMLMGFAGSFGFALALAILLDRLDRRVRYPEQVTKELGLPILGAIPRVANGRGSRGGVKMDQVIEALRGIRLNLIHSYAGNGPLLLTVTSPGGGDGKSFTSSNLALAFAEAGHRTLLIDGDIRRGQLHRLFEVARKPGLTDVLRSEASRDEAIRETDFPSLHFIPCGTRTHTAPELLGSAAMSQLLNQCRSTYSVIIVDSPPMTAGIDPFALGALTGNMLLVIRTGTTNKDMAGAKLDTVDRLPIRVLGAVLNDVRPGAGGGYYYGYYSYYLPGYGADDELVDEDETAEQAGRVLEQTGDVTTGG